MRMFSPWRLLLLTAILNGVSASELPTQQVLAEVNLNTRRYDRLNFSSTAPLIFHSTFALLQQWPNTFFPCGHTIVPGTIPKNTNLYHAHEDGSFPASPEWFAFDAAMAYTIMAANAHPHLLTFRTTRNVNVIYFDGTSAALMGDGSMDSQMLLIHNNSHNVPENPIWGGRPWRPPPRDGHPPPDHDDRPPPVPGRNWTNFNPLQAEYDRAVGLCDFIKHKNLGGLGWGYEGIVRMNAGFELIWCNFSSPSAELVLRLNVSVPALEGLKEPWDREDPDLADNSVLLLQDPPPRRGRPPMMFDKQPFIRRSGYEWFHAAAKTYGFTGGNPGVGEARVRLDSGNIFTFYDPTLAHQTLVRAKNERALLNLTSEGVWEPPSDELGRKIALQKLGRRRRYQRATNISTSDGEYMRQQVEKRMRDALSSQDARSSGIDWHLITKTIVSDYSPKLFELHKLLTNDTNFSNATDVRRWLYFLRSATHDLFMPFYEYPPLPIQASDLAAAFSLSSPQALAALDRCKNQHILPSTTPLNPSEALTSTSITTVLSALCSTLLPLFLHIETLWLTHFNDVRAFPSNTSLPLSLQIELSTTSSHDLSHLEELMAWLGWTEQWTGCSPACPLGQICAIPIWPVMRIGHFSGGPFGMGAKEQEKELWGGGKCVDAENALGGM